MVIAFPRDAPWFDLFQAGKAPRRAESDHSARKLKIIFRFPSACCGLLPRAAALFPQAVGGQFCE
jgi:hypothetical protein